MHHLYLTLRSVCNLFSHLADSNVLYSFNDLSIYFKYLFIVFMYLFYVLIHVLSLPIATTNCRIVKYYI